MSFFLVFSFLIPKITWNYCAYSFKSFLFQHKLVDVTVCWADLFEISFPVRIKIMKQIFLTLEYLMAKWGKHSKFVGYCPQFSCQLVFIHIVDYYQKFCFLGNLQCRWFNFNITVYIFCNLNITIKTVVLVYLNH